MIDAAKYLPAFRTACVSLKGEAYCSPTVVQGLTTTQVGGLTTDLRVGACAVPS